MTTSVHCSLLTILSLFLLLANCSQRHDHFFNRRRCAGCVSRVAPSALFAGFVSKTFCGSRFARVAFGTRCRQERCNLICVQPTGEIHSSNVVSRQPICVEYHELMRVHKYRWSCKSCRWLEQQWGDKVFVVHPVSGWWEPARMYDSKSMLCSCRFCDARGFLLIPRVLIKTLQVGCGVHVATIAFP